LHVTAELRLSPDDAFKMAGFLSGVIVAAILGIVVATVGFTYAMPTMLMALAIALAVRVYQNPVEAAVVGPLFLMAASVLLPSDARFDIEINAWQIYFWAVGLFLITLGAFLKVGYKILFTLPASLQTFLVVAVVASVYGFVHGNQSSFVIRQLFGSLLLGAYFALALQGLDEEHFLRAFRFYGVVCVLGFCAYYAWVFDQYGVHKEMIPLPTHTSILAILFVGRRGWKWWLAAGVMMVVPFLVIARRDLSIFALGLALICAFTTRLRLFRWAMWVLAGVIVVASLVPSYVGVVLDTMAGTSVSDLIPEGSKDTITIEQRGLQLAEAADIVRNSPVLGEGMGGTLRWIDRYRGSLDQLYIENGWAYLLTKMGLAGVMSFLWFVVSLIRWMPGRSVSISACLLSMLLLLLFVEPVFFSYLTAPLAGAIAGLLYRNRLRSNKVSETPQPA
jgi:small basic protein